MPRWLPFVIAVPLIFGLANHGGEGQGTQGDSVSSMEAGSAGSAASDNIRPVADVSSIEPGPTAGEAVTAWSATDTSLRVEVVSDSGGSAEVHFGITSSPDDVQAADFAPDRLPAAYDVAVVPDVVELQVVVAGGGARSVECRIYDGDVLVAVQNGLGYAVCDLTPAGG